MNKKVLGKGLSALIPQPIEPDGREEAVAYIPIEKIIPNPNQPRKTFTPEKLNELVSSIKENGIVQPIVVIQKIDKYEIVVGERRFRAAKAAGLKDAPCIIKKGFTQSKAIETALIENIQREDLNPVEEAMAYQYLIKEHSLTQEHIAKKVGKSRPVITNALRLLGLPMEIRNDVASNIISEGHARLILSLEDERAKFAVWGKIKEGLLSVRQTEELIKNLKNQPARRGRGLKKMPTEVLYIENQLTRALAAKVNIKLKGKDKGKIEISFSNNEDLERIIGLLVYLEEKNTPRQSLNESLL